eukprot:15433416-Alexandrium_andersonii.AAC.2
MAQQRLGSGRASWRPGREGLRLELARAPSAVLWPRGRGRPRCPLRAVCRAPPRPPPRGDPRRRPRRRASSRPSLATPTPSKKR